MQEPKGRLDKQTTLRPAAHREYVGRAGDRVLDAQTGEAALSVLDDVVKRRRPLPDLLVLDLMMPRMGGIELLQRLRRSARWARLPVVVVTGVNDPMLSVRLDLPIAFKPDTGNILDAVRHRLASALGETRLP
jgi:CheY-like chemotaxis protein